MIDPAFTYRAIIRSIYDGDTVRIDFDLGLSTWVMNEPVRLFGIDAPELRGTEREEGLETRDELRNILPIGTEVIVTTVPTSQFVDKKGKYGRYLATIWAVNKEYSDTQFNVNQWLVDNGYAEEYYP